MLFCLCGVLCFLYRLAYKYTSTWLRYYTVHFSLLSKGVKHEAHNRNRWLLRAFVNGNNGEP